MSTELRKDPTDPIVEELHATRRRLLAEHGGVAGLAAFLRQEESKSDRRIASPIANSVQLPKVSMPTYAEPTQP